MKRIVLGIQYDGGSWFGWQSQPHRLTIQDSLEKAINKIALHPIHLSCAGRTDAGVHALEQIAHFDTNTTRPLNSWVRGINAHLPNSIAVRWATDVTNLLPGLEFHSRYSARARTYHYLLYNHPVRSPILDGKVGWVFRPLDVQKMQIAANCLLGEHDFSSFRASHCQAKSPVKEMYEVNISKNQNLIVFTFKASAFLHHMVRNLMGSLILIGVGNKPIGWLHEVLQARDRTIAAPTFMPDGLYLANVDYASHWQLPQKNHVDNWFA